MADPTIVVRAAGDFRRLYGEMSKADSRFGKLGSSIKAGLAGSALAGTAAVVAFGVESVKQAAAAQQSIGATESVFGKYADTVIKRSKEAASAVGLSANEYRELNNVTGATLAATGLPLRRVADLTDQLTSRAADLAATFGGTTKEAIEAVSSLLRGEADPIERYGVSIKQSDVNARLAAKGLDKLEGSAKKQAEQQARLDLLFKQTKKSAGQFARESDTLGGAQQRLGAKVDDLEASFGELLLPALTEGVNLIGNKVVPKLQDLQGYIADNRDEIADMADTVADTLVPALETGVDLVKEAARFFGDLPGPVKEVGIQVSIAALVMPRLAAGVAGVTGAFTAAGASMVTFGQRLAQNRAAMSYQNTLWGKATAAVHGFGGAARSVAGIGGFLALSQGATSSNEAISDLSKVAGGALIGFSVGGPWGAAIGGAAGLMSALSKNTDKAAESAYKSTTTWDTYASTLDEVTGATTRATKSMIIQDLQQSGLLKKVGSLGVSQQTLINGILGRTAAQDQLTSAMDDEQRQIDKLVAKWREVGEEKGFGSDEAKSMADEIARRQDLINSVKSEVGEVKKATAAERERILLMAQVPDNVITKVQTPGAVDSKRELADLAATYRLTPKQIQTIIKMNGIDASKKEIRTLADEIVKSGKVKPSNDWQDALQDGLGSAKRRTRGDVAGLNDLLGGVGNRKPNIANGPFGRGVSGDLSALARTVTGQANRVGSNMGAGMLAGVSGWASAITGKVSSIVNAAVAAGHRAAESRSPSRKTMRLGGYLGEGLAVGVDRSRPRARTAGSQLVQSVLAGVDDGADGVSASIEKITTAIRKAITGKNQGKRETAYLKTLRDEFAALRANGRAQDQVAEKLEKARDKLKDLTEQYNDYSRAIRDSFTATGDVTQLGRSDDGTVAISSLLNDLEKKVLGAERFEVLVAQLAKDGLSRTSVQQLLDAGPEAALATAEAIASGGAASITAMNELQARLAKSGDRLGDLMADRYYGAGVDAAKGIVKGLEAQAKNLDRAALRLANALVKAVKKALGIKSPSREFALIADQVTNGLTYRLDANNTYVKRSGAVLASSLVKGFDNPQLSADVLAPRAAAAAAGPLDMTLHITADAISAAQSGKRLTKQVRAGQGQGARTVAVIGA